MPLPLLAQLWLATTSPAPSELAPGEVDAVELPWARVQELRAAVQDDPSATPPGPWVAEREIELQPVEGGLVLHGRWIIVAEQAGWLAQELFGPGIELRSATLRGDVAPVVTLPGSTTLVAWVERGRNIELRAHAFVPTSLEGRLDLRMLPATRGRLRAAVPGRVPVPVVDEAGAEAPPLLQGGVVWSGASQLAFELRDPDHAPPARETLAVAHAGVGLTVGDAEVRGRAHLQWELRHGELPRVRATISGLGEDLTVVGPSVASWSRTGDTLDVELTAPATARVDLELQWTQAIGATEETRLPLPRIEPEAWRSESSLQLARDSELEVIPAVEEGTAIAAAALPAWGQGLVEGTPTAAYQRAGSSTSGYLDLLRFVPVPGPPSVIDVATYTVATTEEGRVLMKAHYDLRNDRGAHLTVRPPPGLHIIGARVGSETALPSRGDDGAWRIPLRRSLETVDGLLSFPVELILLGEQDPWARRERRELPLPTLDAPIAAARVTVYLPPRYRSRLEQGEHNVVDWFAEGEGLTYGRGVGSEETAVADALFEEAVQGYLENDFEAAQAKLQEIEALGVSNDNMARLQSNIYVIEGKAETKDKGDVTIQRRVKEQARARASQEFLEQEVLIAEAEKAAQAGDYAQAEVQYKAALDLGGKLAKLEQVESVEQDTKNTSVELQLSSVSMKKRSKKTGDTKASGRSMRFGSVGREREFESSKTQASEDTRQSNRGEVLGPTAGGAGGAVTGAVLDPAANDVPGAKEPELVVEHRSDDHEPVDQSTPVASPGPTGAPDDGDDGKRVSEGEGERAEPAEPEPTPSQAPPPIMADVDVDDSDELAYEPVVMRQRPRKLGRRSGIKFKSAGRSGGRFGFRGRAAPQATTAAPDTGTSVYDFADDGLDGAVLTPTDTDADGLVDATDTLEDSGPMLATSGVVTKTPPRDAALPAPKVTASALSVVIPATGEAVRYEQLLIEANQTQTIDIDARRRLRR